MFSALRTRFGIPGLIATSALVFAMTGGAFAAKYLITSTSQIKPSVMKKLKGATGPAGAIGGTGAAGPKGDTGAVGQGGATGATGVSGADGKTVLSGTATPTVAVGALGDFYIETDVSKIYGPKASSGSNGGWGSGTDLKGKEGSPWSAGGTLPAGSTETGSWALGDESPKYLGLFPSTTITFSVRLAGNLDENHVIYLGPGGSNSNCDDGNAGNGAPDAGNPEADSGYLCVFASSDSPASLVGLLIGRADAGTTPGASATGAIMLRGPASDPGFYYGSFAVTG